MNKILTASLFIAAAMMGVSCTNNTPQKPGAYVGGTELAGAENPQATTVNGVLEGVNESGVAVFRGVAYAQAPVGDLRWKAPQPLENWEGVKPAKEFGPNPMQKDVFGDMGFGTDKNSEDCLYLNIWTPAKSVDENLPVFIYYNGGGLMAGAGSEPRYAGMSLARNGIVAITANYREDIFGFLAHPELSAETDYKGSGNYGYMDMAAALQWVKDNISNFGGDPNHITIMGESAGSYAVSTLMVSPLSKNNIAQAMGSSGATVVEPWLTLEQAEQNGIKTMEALGCKNIAEMRAMSAEELLEKGHVAAMPQGNIDNYFMLENPAAIYEKGEQAQVPCLIGNNSAEVPSMFVCGPNATLDGMKAGLKEWLSSKGDSVAEEDINRLMELYGLKTDADVMGLPGYACGGDKFIVHGTWKWMELQKATSSAPVYRYRFCKARPDLIDKNKESALAGGTVDKKSGEPAKPSAPGAGHSVDIEYQMGTIATTPAYGWTAEDFAVSEIFQTYFVNFIKTGNPNGPGVLTWDPINGEDVPPVMCIDVKCHQEKSPEMQERYRLLDKYLYKKQ